MFPQFSVFKGLSYLFINYRHCLFKEKFALVPSAWGMCQGNYISCVWARVLCNGLRGHWEWWRLMQTCTLGNGFRHRFLMGLGCFHPWSWCLHPWSWCRHPWKVYPWRLCSRSQLGHPWRRQCRGYASIWCGGYASFDQFFAVFNFWLGSRRNCGQLGQVRPSFEDIL